VKVEERSEEMPDHKAAIDLVLKELVGENGVLKTIDEVDAIGHRVVHGGEYFNDSVLVDEEVIKKLEDISELAPLHNPANVMGIKVMRELLPGKPNVAVFDTAFHQSMEKHVYSYPLPVEDYEELLVRNFGFHGTSHEYVSGVVAEMLGNKEAKIIVCYFGNGASISAVKNGKVVDTSMGLTPLAGIMMGTRCGDIDPAAVLYIMEKRGLTPKEIDTRMNKKSGFLGIFGESSDFRDIQKGVQSGNERAKLAYDMFCYRIRSYIGSYA
ncbi:acetate/propionate family kinase, partial [Streptobacillus felis]|uniref:acetate/propionate family kinase n=1 Tax=Streptobacillus felis TaxID=1384509 RepID=UPI00082C35D6